MNEVLKVVLFIKLTIRRLSVHFLNDSPRERSRKFRSLSHDVKNHHFLEFECSIQIIQNYNWNCWRSIMKTNPNPQYRYDFKFIRNGMCRAKRHMKCKLWPNGNWNYGNVHADSELEIFEMLKQTARNVNTFHFHIHATFKQIYVIHIDTSNCEISGDYVYVLSQYTGA